MSATAAELHATRPRRARRPAATADAADAETPISIGHMQAGLEMVDDLRKDHDAMRDALFGPDPYQPAGILGALTTSVVKLQTTVEQLPETMAAAIRAERATRGAHKLANWQKASLVLGIMFGIIMAAGTIYATAVGLSHSVFTQPPASTSSK